MKVLNKKEIIYSILLMTIPLVILFTTYFISKNNSEKEQLVIEEQKKEYQLKTNIFNEVEIEGRSAIVKDINTGEILYAKNPDLSLPLASITKVLTVLTVDRLAKEDTVTITSKDLLTEGNDNLIAGESFSVQDLIDLTLSVSSNDGAAALSASVINALGSEKEIDFINEMNNFAKEIGMTRSRFYNETGLDENDKRAGAYGSANDVAYLFEYALKNRKSLFESTSKKDITIKSQEGLVHTASNTNEILDDLPNVLVSKTGYTDIAGGNLAVVIDPFLNKPIVVVVLGSSPEGRFEDVKKLSEKAVEYFKQ